MWFCEKRDSERNGIISDHGSAITVPHLVFSCPVESGTLRKHARNQLIQVIGGHSISGKDIRKIFALLRSEKVGSRQQYSSLLLTTVSSMLNEKGPISFFDLNGNNSGIVIRTPLQWPLNKGFSFSCWLRVENFPRSGAMGLFSFLIENGRGCVALFARDKLIYETLNLKRQCVPLHVNLVRKKCVLHFLEGGSLLPKALAKRVSTFVHGIWLT
ncbi:hypothetical protein ACB092_11G181500 [Castanea dentata]